MSTFSSFSLRVWREPLFHLPLVMPSLFRLALRYLYGIFIRPSRVYAFSITPVGNERRGR